MGWLVSSMPLKRPYRTKFRVFSWEAFSANLGQESVLTVASPAAFGFLSSNPTPITIQGSSLLVPPGRALSVGAREHPARYLRIVPISAHVSCE